MFEKQKLKSEKLLQHDIELAQFLFGGQRSLRWSRLDIRFAPFVAEQVFFVFDHFARSVHSPLEVVAVIDGVGRAGVHAESAQNAAAIINLINLGVAMIHADALFVRSLVFSAFDVNRISRASRRAQKARNATFLAVFVDVQKVFASEAAVYVDGFFGVTDSFFFGWNVAERDAHALRRGSGDFNHVFYGVNDVCKYGHKVEISGFRYAPSACRIL